MLIWLPVPARYATKRAVNKYAGARTVRSESGGRTEPDGGSAPTTMLLGGFGAPETAIRLRIHPASIQAGERMADGGAAAAADPGMAVALRPKHRRNRARKNHPSKRPLRYNSGDGSATDRAGRVHTRTWRQPRGSFSAIQVSSPPGQPPPNSEAGVNPSLRAGSPAREALCQLSIDRNSERKPVPSWLAARPDHVSRVAHVPLRSLPPDPANSRTHIQPHRKPGKSPRLWQYVLGVSVTCPCPGPATHASTPSGQVARTH